MKKYIIFIASAVLMMTACAKEEINTATGETEFISVEFVATKTALDADGKNTNWTEGDKVSVTVNGENLGELAFVGDNKFEGDIKSVGLDGKLTATINYPAGVTTVPKTQAAEASSFADEAALLEGKVTLADLRTGKGGELANKTALLQFKTPVAGDVTFTIGTATYTVTGCSANATLYVCVDPAITGKLSYTVAGGVAGDKTKEGVSFNEGNKYDLGELTYVAPKLYVEDDTDYSGLYLYMFDSAGDNTWPGTKITETKNVNGVTYKVYTVPADRVGKEYTYIFNNNKGAQVEENKKIKFNQDNYLRVTKKYSEVVDASNKGKDDPLTLYIRNDKKWNKLNYYMWIPNGANNQGWPGKAADMNKKTKIENNDYVYVELRSYNYTRIIINNGSAQTADLTVPDTKDDIYVSNDGWIWKGADQSL